MTRRRPSVPSPLPRSRRSPSPATAVQPPPRRFDITRAANASWREAEYTKERARSAESELATAHETIRTLEAKVMTTESRLAQEKRGVAAELQRARDAATEQAARHEHRVAELQQHHDARFKALHDRHRALQLGDGRAAGVHTRRRGRRRGRRGGGDDARIRASRRGRDPAEEPRARSQRAPRVRVREPGADQRRPDQKPEGSNRVLPGAQRRRDPRADPRVRQLPPGEGSRVRASAQGVRVPARVGDEHELGARERRVGRVPGCRSRRVANAHDPARGEARLLGRPDARVQGGRRAQVPRGDVGADADGSVPSDPESKAESKSKLDDDEIDPGGGRLRARGV